ncbi:L,D-transpeptidase [Tropicimonas sp. IMCC34011]|uniref:L,D-transpeptidase n=1 Tax=Tropicimonas sp. IMCC34011 TaxID=2248759 RepID=UPI000E270DA5|nr:L,D-transpeptidase [Tropicimonas sp. IMCC34011]
MQTRRQFAAMMAAIPAAALLPAAARAAEGQQVAPEFMPRSVRVSGDIAPGQIVVAPQQHYLYHVTQPGQATRYGVGVGRAGLAFHGDAVVGRKAEWPSWRPTDEMIEREPQQYAQFADGVPGGPDNPLGARALYLYQDGVDTYFRIHGTTDPGSIGRSVSNGCIRMLNDHVKALYEQVAVGTRVTVL